VAFSLLSSTCLATVLIEDSPDHPATFGESIDISFIVANLDYVNQHAYKRSYNHTWGFYCSSTVDVKPVNLVANGEVVDSCRALRIGDKISCACNFDSGFVVFCLNDGEFYKDLALPRDGYFVLGVALPQNYRVTLVNSEPRSLISHMDFFSDQYADSNDDSTITDRQTIAATRICLKKMCLERLKHLGVGYYDPIEEVDVENSITDKKQGDISPKVEARSLQLEDQETPCRRVPWLRKPPSHLPSDLMQQLQDLSTAELFHDKTIVQCWHNMVHKWAARNSSSASAVSTLGRRKKSINRRKSGRVYPTANPLQKDILMKGVDGRIPLEALIEAAMSPEAISEIPGFVIQVVKLLRSLALSVPKDYSDTLSMSNEMTAQEIFDDDEEEYKGQVASTTLLIVQASLAELGAVKLCCHLLANTTCALALQRETLHLANFLLLSVITQQESGDEYNVQKMFLDVMKAEGAEEGKTPVNVARAIGIRVHALCRDISAYRGTEQLNELYIAGQTLLFLQRACDGQYSRAQDYFREVAADGSEEEFNAVLDTVKLLRVLLEDIPSCDSFIDESVLYILDVAAQALNTLTDMTQGPNVGNQRELVHDNIVQVICNWLRIITPMSVELLSDLIRDSKLPKLEEYARWFGKLSVKVKDIGLNPRWQMYQRLCEIEANSLGVLFSIFNTDLPLETDTILQQIPVDLLVFRFKFCWAGSVLKPHRHIRKFLANKYEPTHPDLVRKFSHFSTVPHSIIHTSTGNYFDPSAGPEHHHEKPDKPIPRKKTVSNPFLAKLESIFTAHSSFIPEQLPIDEDTKKLFLLAWAIQDELTPQHNLQAAFAYYQFLESVCSVSLAEVAANSELSLSDANKLRQHDNAWVEKSLAWTERSPTSLVSDKEGASYRRYFASIEILLQNGNLTRVYFPVPASCHRQIHNPLVKKEMDWTIETVSRDSPEERLDDFLDKSIQVRDVIIFQDWILEDLWTKHICKFITTREHWWVLITMCLTFYINGTILLESKQSNGRDNQFLSVSNISHLQPFMKLHLAMSCLLIINFSLGSAMVTVNRGLSWKRNIRSGAIVLNVTRTVESIYELCDIILPNEVWAIIFLIMDFQTIYYATFLLTSVLGNIYSVAFFSFHVLDVAVRIKLLGYVLKSVVVNGNQVLTTLLLGIIISWIYTVLGIYGFGFDTYTFPNFPDTDYEFPLTLSSKFWQHLDFGLNGSPLFNSYGDYTAQKYVFDITYQIFIVVIMVAIITGIIIDTFADLRSERNAIEDDISNRCFICSQGREIFERNRVKFRDHTEEHHFTWNYLFYSMYLQSKKSTDLTGIERWMQKQILNQSTAYFPIGRAMCLPRVAKEDEAMNDLLESIASLRAAVSNEVKEQRESLSALEDVVCRLKTPFRGPESRSSTNEK